MGTASNNQNQYRKIVRYISGDMILPEKVWFEWIIARDSKTKGLIKEMRNDWNTTGNFLNRTNVNANKAWSNLYSRLAQENLLPEKETANSRFPLQTALKYAAAILLVLVLTGIGGYKYFNPKLITLENSTNQNTLISTLPDGSTIYLESSSTFSYPVRFVGRERSVELNGEAFFEVTKNPHRPFTINTKAASVKVLGTSFNLKSSSTVNFELNVVEGKVGINLNSNPQENIIALAGDRVIAHNDKLIKENAAITRNAKKSMVRLQFQDERLENIINVINKTYGSNLHLNGINLKEKRISVTFENDISSIVNILSVSFNLELSQQPNGATILTEKNE